MQKEMNAYATNFNLFLSGILEFHYKPSWKINTANVTIFSIWINEILDIRYETKHFIATPVLSRILSYAFLWRMQNELASAGFSCIKFLCVFQRRRRCGELGSVGAVTLCTLPFTTHALCVFPIQGLTLTTISSAPLLSIKCPCFPHAVSFPGRKTTVSVQLTVIGKKNKKLKIKTHKKI